MRSMTAVAAAFALALTAATYAASAGAATGEFRPGLASKRLAPKPILYRRDVCPDRPGTRAQCNAAVAANGAGAPHASLGPAGYTPAQLHTAYNLPTMAPSAPTIGIVVAYDHPTAERDLATYSSTFGLPQCTSASGCFRKVNQQGAAGPYPAVNQLWALEAALDVQMAHAICHNCRIILVEANSNQYEDLVLAVDTAIRLGATIVSNSYGGAEFPAQTSAAYDGHFNRPGIAITASTGDYGYRVEYPSSSQYVTAVGGTTLRLAWNGTRQSETAWSNAGSGCSRYSPKPSWQRDTACPRRAVADVSAVADTNTGVAIYTTTPYSGQTGWFKMGGTSVAAPIVAGIYALAGVRPGTGASGLYARASLLNDIVSGQNGYCGGLYLCTAMRGYDGPTGLGTPNGLGAFGGAATPVSTVPTTPTTPVASAPTVALSATPPLSTTATYASFAWSTTGNPSSTTCSLDGAIAVACSSPKSYSPLAAGAHTFRVTVSNAAGSASATYAWTVTSSTPAARAPTVALTSTPGTTTTSTAAGFTWVTTGSPTSTTCSLDGGVAVACSSPKSYSGLAVGSHTFRVTVSNAAGTANATHSWTVAAPAPIVAIPTVALTSAPSASTTSTAAGFTWVATGTPSSTTCSIDGGAAVPCSSPKTYSALAVGPHTFRVTVSNAAGSASASHAWTITTATTGGGGSGYRYVEPVSPTLSSQEAEFLNLVNVERARVGLGPLSISTKLNLAADSHSFWQDAVYGASNLSHAGKLGSSPGDRATDVGYVWSTWGEVTLVASPQLSAAAALSRFMNSPDHRAILLGPSLREIGVGASAYHWTALLAAPL